MSLKSENPSNRSTTQIHRSSVNMNETREKFIIALPTIHAHHYQASVGSVYLCYTCTTSTRWECQTRIVILAILAIFNIPNFKATAVDQSTIHYTEDMCHSRKYTFVQSMTSLVLPLTAMISMNEVVNIKNIANNITPFYQTHNCFKCLNKISIKFIIWPKTRYSDFVGGWYVGPVLGSHNIPRLICLPKSKTNSAYLPCLYHHLNKYSDISSSHHDTG